MCAMKFTHMRYGCALVLLSMLKGQEVVIDNLIIPFVRASIRTKIMSHSFDQPVLSNQQPKMKIGTEARWQYRREKQRQPREEIARRKASFAIQFKVDLSPGLRR